MLLRSVDLQNKTMNQKVTVNLLRQLNQACDNCHASDAFTVAGKTLGLNTSISTLVVKVVEKKSLQFHTFSCLKLISHVTNMCAKSGSYFCTFLREHVAWK